MDTTSYLDSEQMQAQCNAAIRTLEKDNASKHTVSSSLEGFIQDTEIKSKAFDSMKQHMRDYKTILQAMTLANECDIADFQTLQGAVGSELLIGSDILQQKETARISQINNVEAAELNGYKASLEQRPILAANYRIKECQYRAMAEVDQKLYEKWQEKEERYDAIEVATSGLFADSKSLRSAIDAGIADLAGAFQNGTYVPNMSASWRTDISKAYVSQIMTTNADGTVAVDYSQLDKILNKNAEEMTDMDYQTVALVYVLSNDAEVQEYIINNCYDLIEAEQIKEGAGLTTAVVEYEQNGKVNGILAEVEKMGAMFYGAATAMTEEERIQLVNSGLIDKIEQSKAILRQVANGPKKVAVVSQSSLFGGESRSLTDNAITLKRNEDGSLQMQYTESKGLLPYANYESLKHTVDVSAMYLGDTAGDMFGTEDINWYTSTCKLATSNQDVAYGAAVFVGDFTFRKMTTETPILGDILSVKAFVEGTHGDITEVAAYQNVTKVKKMRSLVRYLDLNAIRITDTTNQKSKVSYQISEGIGDSHGSTTSRQRLENFHTNLSSGGRYESLASKIKYDSSEKPILEEVLAEPEVFIGYNDDIVEIDKKNEMDDRGEKNKELINVGNIYE